MRARSDLRYQSKLLCTQTLIDIYFVFGSISISVGHVFVWTTAEQQNNKYVDRYIFYTCVQCCFRLYGNIIDRLYVACHQAMEIYIFFLLFFYFYAICTFSVCIFTIKTIYFLRFLYILRRFYSFFCVLCCLCRALHKAILCGGV